MAVRMLSRCVSVAGRGRSFFPASTLQVAVEHVASFKSHDCPRGYTSLCSSSSKRLQKDQSQSGYLRLHRSNRSSSTKSPSQSQISSEHVESLKKILGGAAGQCQHPSRLMINNWSSFLTNTMKNTLFELYDFTLHAVKKDAARN